MAGRSVIVIGASAGGVETLSALVAALPPEFPAAVLVVVHIPPHTTSHLPAILQRHGRMPAVHPDDGTVLREGVVYVAPPDRHLLVQRGHVRLTRGPRENGHRPAADPLFRSAARAYGPRVIGVVLTGNLDDGTAGLASIARHGGVTVAQDPGDAMYPGMPLSAVTNVQVDHVVPLAALAPLLTELVNAPLEGGPWVDDPQDDLETEIAELEPAAMMADERPGVPSGFSCPSCHGTLFEIREGEVMRYRCRVGHAFGVETLLAQQDGAVEGALWTALQTLKERAALARRMAARMEARGNTRSLESFRAQADDADARAEVIRRVLADPPESEPEPEVSRLRSA
ncbi:MAG TPA: chemotaxis protein CheB [Longimicrobium sp.]|nr:chemotaxis protein CheB [Longimicrobium sp.]